MGKKCDAGVIGLGVMGRNLILNMAGHDFIAAGFDADPQKGLLLAKEGDSEKIFPASSLEEFAGALKTPRVILLLVPAGPPVDSVIHSLLPYIQQNDCIVDCGNSFYKDTDLRAAALAKSGFHYLGAGISGGEAGARWGPSIMPGGPRQAYEIVRPLFEAIAARVDDRPCVSYLGPRSAGHYVKMVHNGIEYGLLQLIAETYDLMKRGCLLTDDEIASVYETMDKGPLAGYLIHITAEIFRKKDLRNGKPIIDEILDEARQKGTGRWTSQDAMELQAPIPIVDSAVSMRELSIFKEERERASLSLRIAPQKFSGDAAAFVAELSDALYASMILVFAQSMALVRRASEAYGFNIDCAEVARIWRGGCIIRTALLDIIYDVYCIDPGAPNLLVVPRLADEVCRCQGALREVAATAARLGIPAAAHMAALSYFDAYRSAWLPANLIQAQRDYFGAHTYERTDEKGSFHMRWESGNEEKVS